MRTLAERERIEIVVIGAGQAGLSAGYHLQQAGLPFVILDANERVGDQWRRRWDSLRLFTPARFNALDGMALPAHPRALITKDEMADYLERYAEHFSLPVRHGIRVDRLSRRGQRFLLTAGDREIEADQVIVAMGADQHPVVPAFAEELAPEIRQFHSSSYRKPEQLCDGAVLIVGAGNSGAEIAMDLAGERRTIVAGRDVGHLPFSIQSVAGRFVLAPFVLRVLFHRVLSTSTPIGRRARHGMRTGATPLIRQRPRDLAALGVERVGRVAGVRGGLPVLEDGTVIDVPNVIWCTGYRPGFSWIDLPVFEPDDPEEPRHERGVVPSAPGLYFTGLNFQHAASSGMVQGAGRDARHVVRALAAQRRTVSRPLAARA